MTQKEVFQETEGGSYYAVNPLMKKGIVQFSTNNANQE